MANEDAKTGKSGRSGWAAPAEGHKRRPARGRAAEDYTKTTRDIRVSVRSYYLADQSQPDENHFVWAYRVKIENRGREAVQLLRNWRIPTGLPSTLRATCTSRTATTSESER